MGFAKNFREAVSSHCIRETEKQELQFANADMAELIEVRHLVSPGDRFYSLLLHKFRGLRAALYEWCDLADSRDEGDKNSIDELAIERVGSVTANKDEIETAIGDRHEDDPVRKILAERLAKKQYTIVI